MKKTIAMAAALVMCLGMTACGDKEKSSNSKAENSSAAEASSADEITSGSEDTADNAEITTENEGEAVVFGQTVEAPAGVKEYQIVGSGLIGEKYSVDLILDDDYGTFYSLEMDKEFGDVLFKFSSNYLLKTDASSGKLGDYELISTLTGESYGALSGEEIAEKFDPTIGKDIVEWSYDGEVKLSEFEEGKLYKAESKEEMPVFVNDTDTDLVVHVMNDWDYMTSTYTYPIKEIEGIGREEQYIFSAGENFYVSVEKLTTDMLSPDDLEIPTVFVNGVEKGEKIDVGISGLLTNAGDNDVDIKLVLSAGDPIEMTVPSGEIYSIDWMKIDHIEIK